MNRLYARDLSEDPERGARPKRRLGRALVAGVLVAAGVAVTGCGSSESPTILNTEKVERAIERSSWDQRGKHAQVTCPAGVHQKKGLAFSCTAVVKRGSTRFQVSQLDGSGRVHYQAR